MSVIEDLAGIARKRRALDDRYLPGERARGWSERGYRTTPEAAMDYLYRLMWVDPDLRASILDIRDMDRKDGRIKKIHKRTAEATVKGGLKLLTKSTNKRIIKEWNAFEKRLFLNNHQKLQSDARGLMMEGNLAAQVVLDESNRVARAVRMASETLLPRVGPNGVFLDPRLAWEQYDLTTGTILAKFALWQIATVRLSPDNWDDHGARGRPYLDANRAVWQKLVMTEEDLVIRRRTRAPLRLSHVLDGATPEQLEDYRKRNEQDQEQIKSDFYQNKKGGVTAVQGDANLDQIADVVHLLDTFFAGSPAPKGLFGYIQGLQRDILEDLKRDYFEEIDAMQDTLSQAYEDIFKLDLLLQGVNPEDYDICIQFAERRTDTPNQRADLALKWQALGVPKEMIFEGAGLDPAKVRDQIEAEQAEDNPYPDPMNIGRVPGGPNVNVTPGNARKGESATTISTRGGG